MSLYEELKKYGNSEMYPLHMPGHKRKPEEYLPEDFVKTDITEIEGFDNLHNPKGIIKDAQEFAADICGADHTYFLVGGSTAGVLASISAAVKKGGKLLMARNSHRSAYNAVGLRDLKTDYIFPDIDKKFGSCEAVTPEQVSRALLECPDAEAVFIVSPTYEGKIADVAGIAKAVHEKGIPLIVDEAHGAHLSYLKKTDGYGVSACRSGADLVIQSVHKTLPAPTQTALVHLCSERISRYELERFLRIYQSSSPSYPLMAGIDGCVRLMARNGREKLLSFAKRFEELISEINTSCKFVKARPFEAGVTDIGKLVLSAEKGGLNGSRLAQLLREKYHIETEMSSERYVLAMFTVSDGYDGYERLIRALKELDGEVVSEKRNVTEADKEAESSFDKDDTEPVFRSAEQKYTVAESWALEGEETELVNSVGYISAEFVNAYPPGTPILVPGESISEKHTVLIRRYLEEGLNVIGVDEQKIRIIKE